MMKFNFGFNKPPKKQEEKKEETKENLLNFGEDELAIPADEQKPIRIEIDESKYIKPHPAQSKDTVSDEERAELWKKNEFIKDNEFGQVKD